MTKKIINLGTADTGNGDPLRIAFNKVNDNFTELYSSVISKASTSASPPLLPSTGDLWWNTNDGNLYVYYSGAWTSSNTAGQGPQGAQGLQGLQGNIGPRGAKGDTGDIGPRGYTGETGAQGNIGPRGVKGDKGDTGAAGATGPAGADGAEGPQGQRGLRGIPGEAGAQGPQGNTGAAGAEGPRGPQGLRGLKGDKGDTGATGPIGNTGPQGIPGLKGDTGPEGPQGPQGLTGQAGTDGSNGLPGPQGDQGDPGTQVQFSLTAPDPLTEGNVWWNMNDGNLYVYYNSQWVSAVSITGITDRLVSGVHELVVETDGIISSVAFPERDGGKVYLSGVELFAVPADPESTDPFPLILSSQQGNVRIKSNAIGPMFEWEFATDGSLTFPDDSIQTTAFTGTGNIEFRNDSMNDINGILITNASQTVASTASISVPANTGGPVTINNVEESTESNALDVVTDFTAYVTLVDGVTTIRDWSQRNAEQIEVNLFVAFATPAYNLLIDLALGRAAVVTYLDNAGDLQTFTSVVSQQFTSTGQGDPSNNWVRVAGRIDGTLPADVNTLALSISSVDFPVEITTNRNWIFGPTGQLTVPGAIFRDGSLYMNSGGSTTASSVIALGNAGSVILRTSNQSTNHDLTFDVTGRTSFPGSLQFSDGSTYDNSTLTGAIDSDLAFEVKHITAVSAEAIAGSNLDLLVVDISENNDITVVDANWEINAGTELAPVWLPVVSTDIVPGDICSINVPGFEFIAGFTYTFRNPMPESKTWTFGSNGTLTLPGDSNGTIGENATGLAITSEREFSIFANSVESFKLWRFGLDGTITFPDSTVQTTAWTGSVNSLVNGVHTATLDNYGHLVLSQGNIEGTTGVGIIANDPAQPDYPVVWAFDNIEEGTGNPTHRKGIIQLPFLQLIESWQNNIRLTNPGLSSITMSGDVVIRAKQQADGDYKTWGFGTDGTLTLPSGGALDANFVGGQWIDVWLTAPEGATKTAGVRDFFGKTVAYAKENSFVIESNRAIAPKVWTFSESGDITLPASGTVVNSTGVSQLANRVEGSWTVATGTATYSFTVPSDGTYTMWVKGNIPNGIITWNATLSVSNTNVPAIGQQYAWNYTGGGSPISLTSIPNQIRGTAGTISTDATYVGATSNRFDFGISNTSGASVTVYYGYTKV